MKKILSGAIGTVLLLSSGVTYSQAIIVATTGTDAADCGLPGSPCATIGFAVSEASVGDSIKLVAGTYAFTTTQLIDKSVVVTAADPANKPVITTSANDAIQVNAADVTISNLNLQLGLTATTGMRGIFSNQNFANLKLTGNEISSTNVLNGTNGNMIWQGFAISLAHPTNVAYTVTITNNKITAASTNNVFGRGIFIGNGSLGLYSPGGVISNNEISAYYAIQNASTVAPLAITGNTIKGISLINSPLANAAISVSGNTFGGDNQVTPQGLYGIVELRSINASELTLENNTINNYTGIGLLVENTNNLIVRGNIFTPQATADQFVSLMANTKMMTNGVQSTTTSDEIEILGNTFNAGLANSGTAIVFADHYGAVTPAFSSIVIGGSAAADRNVFANGIANYITLDANSGASNTVALWAPYNVTTMKPFATNVTAMVTHNTYNVAAWSELNSKFNDQTDNAALGLITYRNENGNRYVATTGSDAANDCTDENSPCKTVVYALNLAVDGDSVIVAPGTYTEVSDLAITSNNTVVIGSSATNLPIIKTTQSTIFDVDATDVTIKNLHLEMGLNATSGSIGIQSTSGLFNNLTVDNVTMTSTADLTTQPWTWNSFGIRLFSNEGAMDTVTVKNSTIGSFTSGKNSFGRTVQIGSAATKGASATITGNKLAGFYALQLISNTGDVLVTENELFGSLMVNAPLTDVNVTVEDNTFDLVNATVAPHFYASMDIRSIELGTVVIENNEVNNFSTIGVLSMASKNVSLLANTFTPLATAEDFIAVMANSKLMTSGVQGNTYANEITMKGNEFNPGASNKGTAIVFADHYGQTAPAFTNIQIGGVTEAEKNTFDSDIENYIVLDAKTGSTSNETLWTGYAETTMKPFAVSFDALYVHNVYNYNLIPEVEDKNTDSLDNEELGKVRLGESPLSVSELSLVDFSMYPNPATDFIQISIAEVANNATVEIMDVLGNKIATQKLNANTTVNIQSLASGVYVASIKTNGQIVSKRFVKK